MTGKVINFRQAKKRKARAEKAELGNANAAKHGLSPEVRDLAAANREKSERDVDGHERDET